MNMIEGYALSYPQIEHPLLTEKNELKKKYISLLKIYMDKFFPGDQVVLFRLKTFSNVLFGNTQLANATVFCDDVNNTARTVQKTRFTPFRLFSYRYLFLFDSIFLLAPDDMEMGNKICDELKSTVHKRYHDTLETMKNKMYSAENDFAYKKLITEDMVQEWNQVRTYISSNNRNITFTATMSAGKSTLINAIVGKELSYAKMAACTSTVMKFKNSPNKSDMMNVICDDKVQELLSESDVRAFTKQREVPCDISGHFLSVLSDTKITLIDTPGVNSSQNPIHKKITRKELTSDSTDILVYVIPVENYGSEGDFAHLSYIKKKVHYNRIIFIVNMMDSCDFEDDSVSEIVENIKEHLETIGYDEPIICPISAKAGMLMKQVLLGRELSENDRKACQMYTGIFQAPELALGQYYPTVKKIVIPNDISWLRVEQEALWSAYVNTGLPGFEALLYNTVKEEE